ncbi:putative modified peptide [Kribbella sandramycini]|uniref:Putative modified peptide n=1 Tax=Kribbella sandramycini TaxID=60450 RepID=A0A7Y4KYR4_9ACTN|nr:NHLP-related RiPP peptide [Kribbella sandramycini]MBB6569012.1 putative modified peptide [Kribbella sandramycini]NOL41144.1 putative modified peptide [Kribbella sandramycini]
MTATATKLQIPAAVADRLLELLATDDTFRDLFTHDRHAALITLGLDPELVKIAPLGCMAVETLAPKAAIAAARAELTTYLTAANNHTNPHVLESGAMHAVLRHN